MLKEAAELCTAIRDTGWKTGFIKSAQLRKICGGIAAQLGFIHATARQGPE